MGAEHVPAFEVVSFAVQIEIEGAKQGRKAIGVFDFDLFGGTGGGAEGDAVRAGRGGEPEGEELGLDVVRHRQAVVIEEHGGTGRAGKEGADFPGVGRGGCWRSRRRGLDGRGNRRGQRGRFHLVGTEDAECIGMAALHNRGDVGVRHENLIIWPPSYTSI